MGKPNFSVLITVTDYIAGGLASAKHQDPTRAGAGDLIVICKRNS
jgi:hypothetical protein